VGGRESAETVRKRQLRWRKENRKAWRQMRAGQKKRYYRRSQKNNRHRGKRWTPVEDAKITAKDRPTDRKLSKTLGRSAQAIQQRRSCLRARLRQQLHTITFHASQRHRSRT
jgi:hypothetical protein